MTFVNDMTGRLTSDKSISILLLVNVLTLLAALYYGWDVFTLMLLFWFETAIIGIFTVIKLIHSAKLAAVALVPFFCFHFGMFMFVHLTFLFAMFGSESAFSELGFFEKAKSIIQVVALPALALFASHLYSFFTNYIGKREYATKSPMHFFSYPYPRVIVMHITIIIGGFLTMILSPQFALILLAILKTGADVGSHLKMHKKQKATGTAAFQ